MKKKCSNPNCEKPWKDVSEFNERKKSKDGLTSQCKKCIHTIEKERRKTPKRQQYIKQYRKDHKDKLLQNRKIYYRINIERERQNALNWYHNNKLKQIYLHYINRDKKREFTETVDYSYEEFEKRIQNGYCYYCGRNFAETVLGLDRTNNLKGHSKANTIVACGRCNRTRSNKFTVKEFKLFSPILKKIDLNRIKKT